MGFGLTLMILAGSLLEIFVKGVGLLVFLGLAGWFQFLAAARWKQRWLLFVPAVLGVVGSAVSIAWMVKREITVLWLLLLIYWLVYFGVLGVTFWYGGVEKKHLKQWEEAKRKRSPASFERQASQTGEGKEG